MAAKSYSQSSCFAYMVSNGSNYSKILYISKVFDGEDFSGNKDYAGIKFSIREALKNNCKALFGSQSYGCQFEVVTKDADGHLLTNHYDANLERKNLTKKLTSSYSSGGWQIIEFKVEP